MNEDKSLPRKDRFRERLAEARRQLCRAVVDALPPDAARAAALQAGDGGDLILKASWSGVGDSGQVDEIEFADPAPQWAKGTKVGKDVLSEADEFVCLFIESFEETAGLETEDGGWARALINVRNGEAVLEACHCRMEEVEVENWETRPVADSTSFQASLRSMHRTALRKLPETAQEAAAIAKACEALRDEFAASPALTEAMAGLQFVHVSGILAGCGDTGSLDDCGLDDDDEIGSAPDAPYNESEEGRMARIRLVSEAVARHFNTHEVREAFSSLALGGEWDVVNDSGGQATIRLVVPLPGHPEPAFTVRRTVIQHEETADDEFTAGELPADPAIAAYWSKAIGAQPRRGGDAPSL